MVLEYKVIDLGNLVLAKCKQLLPNYCKKYKNGVVPFTTVPQRMQLEDYRIIDYM